MIRNDQGQVLASLSQQISLPHSSDVVEALATAWAISFDLEIGCSSFILEGDSKTVIKTLNCEEDSLSPFGYILALAKATTEANCCISFSHIRRLGNSVTHNLTTHTRHVRGFLVWMKDISPYLYSVLFTDNDWVFLQWEFLVFIPKKKKVNIIFTLIYHQTHFYYTLITTCHMYDFEKSCK